MKLPENIEEQILDYLHLELGEDPSNPLSLKLENIEFFGVFEIYGKPTHYYKFGRKIWATVEPYGDSYMIGMTTFSPKPILKQELYEELHIQSLNGCYVESFKLEKMGDGFYCFPNFKKIITTEDEELSVLVEANTNMPSTQVILSIKEGKRDVYLKGSVGFQFRYKTKNENTLIFTFGTGPWE